MKKKSSNLLSEKWWAETLGLYRDERIDFAKQVAAHWAFIIQLLILMTPSGYLVGRGHWSGWAIVGLLGLGSLYHVYVRRRLGGEMTDEYVLSQYLKATIWLPALGAAIPLIFWLAPINTPVPEWFWPSVVAGSLLIPIATLFYFRAYPARSLVLMATIFVLAAVVGYEVAGGNIPVSVMWVLGITYGLFTAFSLVYYLRHREN